MLKPKIVLKSLIFLAREKNVNKTLFLSSNKTEWFSLSLKSSKTVFKIVEWRKMFQIEKASVSVDLFGLHFVWVWILKLYYDRVRYITRFRWVIQLLKPVLSLSCYKPDVFTNSSSSELVEYLYKLNYV